MTYTSSNGMELCDWLIRKSVNPYLSCHSYNFKHVFWNAGSTIGDDENNQVRIWSNDWRCGLWWCIYL